ncbi:methyltransferase [Prochlorococcus marinus]|uniref:Methylase involved in ubiquinone/menaquinone biosynthesis n=1 Tax=Prochlorococcus marinus (strain MIT 9211) TaxID=93059 RepID=A9BCF9_PROM4|nr:methyltransferase [Prochlorococcus marinus]ABX09521.1 Methylase involved in ubiquinone/menaquinone biosynthesis [Prochlorococcus marinus str. MIT 9211]
MTNKWQDNILKNFDSASTHYNEEAFIQNTYAKKLAKYCSQKLIPPGIWADLGAGTGLLADALEKLNPQQSVLRVDGSREMLKQHSLPKKTQLWDLNLGLPTNWSESPSLLASNFALHWLSKPELKVQEWFSAIAPGGWLAIALPVKGSFPEWHKAAALAKVRCTALSFPSHTSLTDGIPINSIHVNQLEKFTQTATGVSSLLKPLVKVGATSTPEKSLKLSHWRRLHKEWPLSLNSQNPQLTWLVQILLIQK